MKIQGLAVSGSIYTTGQDKLELNTATVQGVDKHRNALDVLNKGYFSVGGLTVASGTENQITFTAVHGAKRGDAIRVLTTANSVEELEFSIKKIISTTVVEIDGFFTLADGTQSSLASPDTVTLLRAITPSYSSSGGVIAGPMQILRGAGGSYADTSITKDTTVAANTIAMPVEIVGAAGTEINITAGDINVQLTHAGANPDSTQIGNGTNILGINASLEALVHDTDALVELTAIKTAVEIIDNAISGSEMQVDIVSAGTIATETTLDAVKTAVEIIDNAIAGTEMQVDIVDAGPIATETTLAAMSAKLPAALGRAASAASLTVTQSTEDQAVQAAIRTAVEIIDNAISGTEMQVDIVSAGTIATEVTLAALNAKIGTHDIDTSGGTENRQGVSLRISESGGSIEAKGQKVMASSIPVTIASDQSAIPVKESLDVLEVITYDATASGDITSAAFVQILAALSNEIKAIQIFCAGGSMLELAQGAAASEVVKMIVAPGGFPGHIMPVNLTNGERLSLRVRSAMSGFSVDFVGQILINLLG